MKNQIEIQIKIRIGIKYYNQPGGTGTWLEPGAPGKIRSQVRPRWHLARASWTGSVGGEGPGQTQVRSTQAAPRKIGPRSDPGGTWLEPGATWLEPGATWLEPGHLPDHHSQN